MPYREELTHDISSVEEHTRSFLEIMDKGWPSAEMRVKYCELLQAFIGRWGGEFEICPVTGDAVRELVEVWGVLMGKPLALRYMTEDQEAKRIVEEVIQKGHPSPDKPPMRVVDLREDQEEDAEEAAIKEAIEREDKNEDVPGQSWGTLAPEGSDEEGRSGSTKTSGRDAEQDYEEENVSISDEERGGRRETGSAERTDQGDAEQIHEESLASSETASSAEDIAGKIRGTVMRGSRPDVMAETLNDQVQNITSWSKPDCTAFFMLFLQSHKEFTDKKGDSLWVTRQTSRLKRSPFYRPNDNPMSQKRDNLESAFIADAISESLKTIEGGFGSLDIEDLQVDGIEERMKTKLNVASEIMVQVLKEEN